jgi:hypothetical protein
MLNELNHLVDLDVTLKYILRKQDTVNGLD